LLYDGQRVIGLEGYQGDQHARPERFFASIVIGADGINSLIARQVKAPIYRSDPPQFFQYYTFFENFVEADEAELALFSLPEGQSMLVFPIEEQLMALSWSVPVGQLSTVRGRVPTAFQQAWQSLPELRERGRKAVQTTKMKGRLPTPAFFRQPWGDGWALIGDASFHTDPSGGRGFYDACRSAELLVHAFVQSCRGRKWEDSMRLFHSVRDLEFEASYQYIRMLGGDESINLPAFRQLQRAAWNDQGAADILLSLNKSISTSLLINTPDWLDGILS
jgi:2-polyprenyl-6-methoxyphenol hydroxylase-like FAD-dependent oxidoreductase